jgi:hypothetical protein
MRFKVGGRMRRWLVIHYLGWCLAACAAQHESAVKSERKGYSTKGLTAFQNGFYAFAHTQGCVKCHAASQHPTFAAADILVAYDETRGNQLGSMEPLIDFTRPDDSIIADYAGNKHCKDTPCSDPVNSEIVKGLLEAWARVELTWPAKVRLSPPGYKPAP